MRWKNRAEMVHSFGAGLVCAEVGVFRGEFSRVMLAANPKELHLVDLWEKQEGEYDRDRMNDADFEYAKMLVQREFGKDPRVRIVPGWSAEVAKMYPDEFFDYVYIDADHTWQGITSDLLAWWPKVKSGGWICGHDYGLLHSHAIETGPVVRAWAEIKGVEVHESFDCEEQSSTNSWAIQKP